MFVSVHKYMRTFIPEEKNPFIIYFLNLGNILHLYLFDQSLLFFSPDNYNIIDYTIFMYSPHSLRHVSAGNDNYHRVVLQ